LLLVACGDDTKSISSDARVEEYAKDQIRAKLRDPDSAVFQGVGVSRRSGKAVVCGRVNSKNGFGGMTGSQRFAVAGMAVLEEEAQPGTMDEIWEKACS
jgi:hypothetical protein